MNILSIITAISLIVAISNGIGMIVMYLRYVQVIQGTFAALRATEDGEVEIMDLFSNSRSPFIR